MKGPKPQKIKRAPRKIIKIDIFHSFTSVNLQQPVMSAAAEIASVSSKCDIFAQGPQTSVLGTIETAYKRIAPVHQNDLELFIPADNDTYIDLNIKLYVRGKLISASGNDVELTDATGLTNNFHYSLFSQCNFTLN